MQRVFDRLSNVEMFKMLAILIWEVIAVSFINIKEFILKSENDAVSIQSQAAEYYF